MKFTKHWGEAPPSPTSSFRGTALPPPLSALSLRQCESYYVTFVLWHEPSVCRLSDVLHSTQRLEIFSNIMHRLIAEVLGQFVLKFWGKIQGFYGIVNF